MRPRSSEITFPSGWQLPCHLSESPILLALALLYEHRLLTPVVLSSCIATASARRQPRGDVTLVRRSRLGYRDALSLSTILLAAGVPSFIVQVLAPVRTISASAMAVAPFDSTEAYKVPWNVV